MDDRPDDFMPDDAGPDDADMYLFGDIGLALRFHAERDAANGPRA